MPSLDEEAEVTNSSDVTDLDEQSGAEPKGDAKPTADIADSSAATGEEDSGLLSVVRDVVDKTRKPETASPAEGEEDGDQGEQPTKGQDDEYSDVPFHKHPAFQKVIREKNAYREDAVRYHNVVGFLEDNGLSSEEASDALLTAAMAKTDPAKAWELVKPWVQKLLVAAGEVLPDDIQQRVQNGEISREAALELSRAKASTESMRAAQTFREQQAQAQQQRAMSSAVTGAAVTWETERRLRDPNFGAKMSALQKEVAWLQAQEGKPNTPDGVRAQLNKAYRAVNAAAAPVQPQPRKQTTPRSAGGGQVAGNARPSEMSTLEIIRANRRAG